LKYQVEWKPGTLDEMKVFQKRFRQTIIRKIQTIADDIPTSLKLRSVQPVKGQDMINVDDHLYELDIASGQKAAFAINDEKKILIVYMVGNHEYACANYLKLASERLKVDKPHNITGMNNDV